MSEEDEIITGLSLISIVSLMIINELIREALIPALILIPVSAFIVGSWLLRRSRQKRLDHYLKQQEEDHSDE